jgi:hypothetical protein
LLEHVRVATTHRVSFNNLSNLINETRSSEDVYRLLQYYESQLKRFTHSKKHSSVQQMHRGHIPTFPQSPRRHGSGRQLRTSLMKHFGDEMVTEGEKSQLIKGDIMSADDNFKMRKALARGKFGEGPFGCMTSVRSNTRGTIASVFNAEESMNKEFAAQVLMDADKINKEEGNKLPMLLYVDNAQQIGAQMITMVNGVLGPPHPTRLPALRMPPDRG